MKTRLGFALLPFLAFAPTPASAGTADDLVPPKFRNIRQNPVYVDVESDKLTLHPEIIEFPATDIEIPGGAFAQFLDRIQAARDSTDIVLLLRPGSAMFQRRLRQRIRDRGIDVGFEPWEHGRQLVVPPPDLSPAGPPEAAFPSRTPPATLKVLVRPPLQENLSPDKAPVFFECRGNPLFLVSIDTLKQAVDAKTHELMEKSQGSQDEFLKLAGQTQVEVEGRRLDFAYALMDKYVLSPMAGAEGCALPEQSRPESDDGGYGSKLAAIDAARWRSRPATPADHPAGCPGPAPRRLRRRATRGLRRSSSSKPKAAQIHSSVCRW